MSQNTMVRIQHSHGSIQCYHAHIYFDSSTRSLATELREKIVLLNSDLFDAKEIYISPLIETPVGPHLQPMFEVQFPTEGAHRFISWLDAHRARLSILVHEVTGDDPRDHAEGARWLGEPVVLDHSKLELSPVVTRSS